MLNKKGVINMEKQLKKEYLDLGCWGMSFKKYRNFMDKCEKLGYEVWEDFQFLDRVVVGKKGTLYIEKESA